MVVAPPALPVPALIHKCAPFARPKMMAAIVKVESGGNKYVMWDNSTGRRYIPADKIHAAEILERLISRGDKVDVGIAQVDTENFRKYGLTSKNVFHACVNIRAGAEILEAGYRMAVNAGYSGQIAFYHAFEAYNSGRLYGDARYADAVLRAAGIPVYVSRPVSGSRVDMITYRAVPPDDFSTPFVSVWNPNSEPIVAGQSNGTPARFATAWSAS